MVVFPFLLMLLNFSQTEWHNKTNKFFEAKYFYFLSKKKTVLYLLYRRKKYLNWISKLNTKNFQEKLEKFDPKKLKQKNFQFFIRILNSNLLRRKWLLCFIFSNKIGNYEKNEMHKIIFLNSALIKLNNWICFKNGLTLVWSIKPSVPYIFLLLSCPISLLINKSLSAAKRPRLNDYMTNMLFCKKNFLHF